MARSIPGVDVTEKDGSVVNRLLRWMLETMQLWPWLSVITGDFSGIIHSINGVMLVLITGISGHNSGWNFTANQPGMVSAICSTT